MFPTLLTLCTCLILTSQQEEDDLIDISNITVFPQDYKHNLRAGYFNTTPYNQALYYIFAESMDHPDQDPVILWLNGGPGCSSLTGFFTEIGPFMFKEEDPSKMYHNPYAWNKKANILFLQSPGTVGFSQATQAFKTANDTSVAKDNLKALQQFFYKYPQYQGNDFYIAGESYAGIYIPRLASQILDFNEQLQESKINFRGILIGNACTHPYQCYTAKYYSRFSTQFWYTRGFIEQTDYTKYKATCLTSQSSAACLSLQKIISDNFIASGANIYNIYAKCYHPVYPPKYQEIGRKYEEKKENYNRMQHGLKHPLRCTDAIGPLTVLNRNQFRYAFKVYEFNDTLFWTPCSDTLNYTIESKAAYSTLPKLVAAGLKIFYFTGDLDAIVPITGTLYWFDNYRIDYGVGIKKSWRPWVTSNQNVSGMVWELSTMTLATVRGAGHMVPSDKPAEAQEILQVFLQRRQWKYPDYYLEQQ